MISYYELLGMIKEDKAPEKIRVHLTHGTSKIYVREDDIEGTFSFYGLLNEDEENGEYKYYLSECLLENSMFDKNIEILDEKKIEKLYTYCSFTDYIYDEDKKGNTEMFLKDLQESMFSIVKSIDEIIDYLKSKGE